MLLPAIDYVRGQAEGIRCRNNLRQLHTILSNYLTDRGHWPQVPEHIAAAKGKEGARIYGQWWIDETKPYGATAALWQCPTYLRKGREQPGGLDEMTSPIHYFPTQFDENRATPHKWPTQPWLMEVGNFHGKGNFMILPDGSLKEFDPLR